MSHLSQKSQLMICSSNHAAYMVKFKWLVQLSFWSVVSPMIFKGDLVMIMPLNVNGRCLDNLAGQFCLTGQA